MKAVKAFILATCVALSSFLGAAPRVIFDTDLFGDVDDVGALAVLNALADAGECEILGVVSSTRRSSALGLAEMVCSHYGRTNLPMGVCKDLGVDVVELERQTSAHMRKRFFGVAGAFREMVSAKKDNLRYPISDAAPDANAVYRQLLASSPDGSVVLCTVGFFTNVRRLLETPGDAISPLTGRELVAKKVKAWYAMGGRLPSGFEFNIGKDAASAAKAIAECSVPITFVDFSLGVDVLTGAVVARKGEALCGPVAEAYVRSLAIKDEEKTGGPSWDQLTVLAAVRGAAPLFVETRGTMTVDPLTGSNTWTCAENGPHAVLKAARPKAELAALIDELMARPPRQLGRVWPCAL